MATLAIAAAVILSTPSARAQDDPGDGNPYSGYSGTTSYFLDYSRNSFDPGSSGDVGIDVTVAGLTHDVDVDTGSRGFYMSSDELGSNFQASPDAFAGKVVLTSSRRVLSGLWTSSTLSFDVTDQSGSSTTVTSTPDILDITTLGAEMNHTAKYDIDTSVAGYTGYVNLVVGGSIAVQTDANGDAYVRLTHSATIDQQIAYTNNTPGLIKDVSNFGIGFSLGGASGGTGPVGNNTNQIYNPLLNLTQMNSGSMVGGYIVESKGIQLGLTMSNTGYAYTTLNSTGLSSTNSQPDWQTPMGQTVVRGVTNAPGSVVMDSGISDAFISAPGLTDGDILSKLSVDLMNSGGAVGYDIDMDDSDDLLNPDKVTIVPSGTDGVYSQNLPPWGTQFFNTGRNVFEAFDMLYDAEDGYMGLLTNAYGATSPYVYFDAQPGGFPDPVPEGGTTPMLMLGFVLLVPVVAMTRCFGKRRGLGAR